MCIIGFTAERNHCVYCYIALACNETSYGQDCQQNCGHCSGRVACNKTTGQCASCEAGWILPLCDKGIYLKTYYNNE